MKNTSAVDSVTITSLTDNVYGDLDGKGTCDVPQTIAAGDTYSCSFTGPVSGGPGTSHTDVVTAAGKDDDGNDVSDSDDAVVSITSTPSSIEVTKTADPTSLPEPGGNASFSVSVKNTSAVDSVTISSLTDDKFGNLDGKGTCDVSPAVVLAPGESYSCSFTGAVSGNAGDSHVNVVTASGKDDDGNDVSDSDDATVTITDVSAAIQVTKTANPTSLPEPGGNATFAVEIKNLSAVDSVTISSLTDDIYGNLDGKGTCDVPQTIAPGGSYSCSFTGAVSGNAGSSHTDVVTASGHGRRRQPGLRPGRRGRDDHERRQLDPGDEDGDADLVAGAGRQRDVRREGREHLGRRLGHDLEPHGRRLRQPRRQGHVRRAADAGARGELQLLVHRRGQRQRRQHAHRRGHGLGHGRRRQPGLATRTTRP